MVEIPVREPSDIVAGDTIKWYRLDLTGDFPATDGWSLAYTLRLRSGTGNKIAIAAAASGDGFLIAVAAATSAAYPAGEYELEGYVTKSTERYRVYLGTCLVRPNLAGEADGAHDSRSHAERVLDAIEATIEGRASNDQLEYTVAGRSLRRMAFAELHAFRSLYRAEVAREKEAERIRRGLGSRRNIYVRMP